MENFDTFTVQPSWRPSSWSGHPPARRVSQ
jgi:hypothetical protein